MNYRIGLVVTLLVFLSLITSAQAIPAQYSLVFDQDTYNITAGERFGVNVLIQPPPNNGLFSFGVRVFYDDSKVDVVSEDDIVIPDAFLGGFFPPVKDLMTPNGTGVNASVADFFTPYHDSLLATFYLTDMTPVSAVPASYEISLGLYYDINETRTNFVDFSGMGTDIDPQITYFDAATINVQGTPVVIPAPASLILGLIGCTLVTTVKRRFKLHSTLG